MLMIRPISISSFDYEYRRIIKKLKQYGIKPTGNKTSDKARLKEIEMRELKEEESVSNKHLTISKGEQERVLEKKAKKDEEKYPQFDLNRVQAEELLGQQLLQSIEIKQKKKII